MCTPNSDFKSYLYVENKIYLLESFPGYSTDILNETHQEKNLDFQSSPLPIASNQKFNSWFTLLIPMSFLQFYVEFTHLSFSYTLAQASPFLSCTAFQLVSQLPVFSPPSPSQYPQEQPE